MRARWSGRPQPLWLEKYRGVIKLAIEICRPPVERWAVTTYEPSSSIVRLDFARGIEVPHSSSFALDNGDDVSFEAVFGIVCQFLRRTWSGGIEPS